MRDCSEVARGLVAAAKTAWVPHSASTASLACG